MISQFFILSPRGDVIVLKEFRGDVSRDTGDFFRKVKFWDGGDAPPVFVIDGLTYCFIKKGGLYFSATTRSNVSPSFVLELLVRVTTLIKDFCGSLGEETLRKNFPLVLEIMDEVMDFGYVQGTATEGLKPFIFNEPVVVDESGTGGGSSVLSGLKSSSRTTKPSSAVNKPISWAGGHKRTNKSEVFLDVLEKVSVLFSSTGAIQTSTIDGSVLIKSYLQGNPDLRLGLNEDLVIGRGGATSYGAVALEDVNFNDVCRLDHFESERVIEFTPPEGEFVVLNYRVAGEFRVPFRVFSIIDEDLTVARLEVLIKIRADVNEATYGSNVVVRVPVPKSTSSATAEFPAGVQGHTGEYKPADKVWQWTIKKFPGGQEFTARLRIILAAGAPPTAKKEIGPVSMSFELPMHSASGLQIRFLRIIDGGRGKAAAPFRWVRYLTISDSYVARI